MTIAWSPSKVPDVSDPQSPAANGGAGALISPNGIASLETFGACVVSTSGGGGVVTGASDAIGVLAIGER